MMTQADILGKNQDMYTELSTVNPRIQNQSFDSAIDVSANSSQQPQKPSNFGGAEFPDMNTLNLTENSPIRPSKYFASDSAINTSKGLRNIIIGGVSFSLVVTLALIIQLLFGTTQIPNRVGIVTQEKECSDIGANMVRMGGNSIDAYIASSLCLSVVNPFVAGLGAGGFLLIRDHKHEQDFSLNCFFKSSANLDLKEYENNPGIGRKSVAIPGELKCLQIVYHKYARFYWKTLAEPSIRLARDGFRVSKLLETHLKELDLVEDIKNNPQMAKVYLKANESLVVEGDTIKNPDLADTIELLAKKENIFYEDGDLGNNLVKELNDNNQQQITLGDLKSYAAQDKVHITANYNDFVFMTTSFPSMGPTLKFIIDLLGSFSFDINSFKSADVYAKILEASKIGYILSSYTSDPQYGVDQTNLYNEKLTLAKSYLQNLNDSQYPFDSLNVKLKDNIVLNFISVNDHNDLMVSYVGTLGSAWGSRIMTKKGYILNNGLSLFSYNSDQNPDKSNSINSNKQPRGLIAPILTYNKKNPCIRRLCISYSHHGESFDDYAISELTQVMLKVFTDFSLYESSLSDKRMQYSARPANGSGVCYEDGFDASIQEKIESQNHFVKADSCMFHSIDMVMKKDHVIYGKEDSTRSTDSLVLVN